MNRSSIQKICFLIVLAFTSAFLVLATHDANAGNGYLGLGIGNAHSTFNRGSIPFDQPDLGNDETSYRLFGGYQVNDYFSIEGAYDYFGKAKASENVFGDYFETEVTGLEVGALGFLPVGATVSVFAKAGIIFWHSDINFKSAGPLGSGSRSATGNDFVVGLGVKYDFTRRFGTRLEYNFYDIDKVKAGSGSFQVISISGVFAF